MRGAFDFETWEWVYPLCCGFVWESKTGIESHFIRDESKDFPQTRNDTGHALMLAEHALRFMYEMEEVSEWWAHNMGNFDGLQLIAAAVRMGWRAEATLAGGTRVIVLQCGPKDCKRMVTIKDSLAVVDSSLKSAAKDFNLPSRKVFDESDYKGDMRDVPLDRLKRGCLTDCALVLELLDAVDKQVIGWGGKGVRSTFSATAMHIIKEHMKEKGIKLPDCKLVNPHARNAYYGGRIEVFHHRPDELLVEYDINSSYPAVMSRTLPWEFIGGLDSAEVQKRFHRYCESHYSNEKFSDALLIEADVDVPEQPIPPLPYKLEGKGVFFPTGQWRAWFTANELRYALQECRVAIRPVKGLLYSARAPFQGFINEVFERKAKSTGAERYFCKQLICGSYGKFGEKPEHQRLKVFATVAEAMEYQARNPLGCYDLFNGDERIKAIEHYAWAAHAHFGIAAWITAGGRIAIHQHLVNAVRPVYTDTDSIHCSAQTVYLHPAAGPKLGQLKEEHRGYLGRYYAPKIYSMHTQDWEVMYLPPKEGEKKGKPMIACKGFPVSEEEFKEMVAQKPVKVARMQKMKTQLKRGGREVARVEDVKTWHGNSSKRSPLEGGATRAWTVNELLDKAHLKAKSPWAVQVSRPAFPDVPKGSRYTRFAK